MVIHLQLALNGDSRHPAAPKTAEEIAVDAAKCVRAGATLLHLHAFDDAGDETLEAGPVGRMLTAVRRSCPGVPLNVTTFASIVPDPALRYRLIENWTVLPDLVAANQGEEGIDDVSAMLAARGVGIEACVLGIADTEQFISSGNSSRFERLVIEPLEDSVDDALALDAEIEKLVLEAGIELPQLHHGVGVAGWHVNRRAVRRGHSIRTGLEDTDEFEDGTPAASNAALTVAALGIIRQHHPAS